MKHQHAHTLQALFSHPIQHDLRMRDVEALMWDLNAQVERRSNHRLNLQLASGETLVLHAAHHLQPPMLDAEGVLRLRRFLESAGITPEHPQPPEPHGHGDQAKRLVIHLDHRGARLWWLEGDEIDTTTLQPHGLWGSHQRLTHRHDRDVAGQKAPLDYGFLKQLSEAVVEADRVLLFGHGHGDSDLRQVLRNHLEHHHPQALKHLEIAQLDDTASTDAELLALARAHFGNKDHRQAMRSPGQDRHEADASA